MRTLFWISLLVTVAATGRWFIDYVTAPVILLSLTDAVFSPTPDRGPSQGLFAVESDLRLAIFAHPPNRLRWRLDLRPGSHQFTAAVALDPAVWSKSDGVSFRVVTIEGGERKEIGAITIDPRARDAHRRWVPVSFDFETVTPRVAVALEDGVGPGGGSDFDWAYWAEPRIASLTRPPDGKWVAAGFFGMIVASVARRRKKVSVTVRRGYVALAFSSVAIAFLLSEAILRQFPWWVPRQGDVRDVGGPAFAAWAATTSPDPELGYRHLPQLALEIPRAFHRLVTEPLGSPYIVPETEWIQFQTDEDGFRNVPLQGPPEVIVLGDSFAAADLMDNRNMPSAILSKDMGVGVRSLAVSGYGPQQYLNALRRYGIVDQPQLVVLLLFEGNDIDDAADFEQWRRSHLTWLEFATKGMRTMLPSIITQPHARSQVLMALTGVEASMRDSVFAPTRVIAVPDPFNPVCGPGPDGLDCMSFDGTMLIRETRSREEWLEHPGLALTLESLGQVKALCERSHARFLTVLVPTKESIYLPKMTGKYETGNLDRYLQNTTRGMHVPPAPNLPERFALHHGVLGQLLKELLEKEGIAVLDLRPGLDAAADRGRKLYLRFDIHWNEAGHAEVARLIREELSRRGWMPSASSSRDPL